MWIEGCMCQTLNKNISLEKSSHTMFALDYGWGGAWTTRQSLSETSYLKLSSRNNCLCRLMDTRANMLVKQLTWRSPAHNNNVHCGLAHAFELITCTCQALRLHIYHQTMDETLLHSKYLTMWRQIGTPITWTTHTPVPHDVPMT